MEMILFVYLFLFTNFRRSIVISVQIYHLPYIFLANANSHTHMHAVNALHALSLVHLKPLNSFKWIVVVRGCRRLLIANSFNKVLQDHTIDIFFAHLLSEFCDCYRNRRPATITPHCIIVKRNESQIQYNGVQLLLLRSLFCL